VDQEGTRRGFDVELVRAVSTAVSVPVIASGGMGSVEHMLSVLRDGLADAVAIADALHYGRETLPGLKHAALAAGFDVRTS
jgi:cyclase